MDAWGVNQLDVKLILNSNITLMALLLMLINLIGLVLRRIREQNFRKLLYEMWG